MSCTTFLLGRVLGHGSVASVMHIRAVALFTECAIVMLTQRYVHMHSSLTISKMDMAGVRCDTLRISSLPLGHKVCVRFLRLEKAQIISGRGRQVHGNLALVPWSPIAAIGLEMRSLPEQFLSETH